MLNFSTERGPGAHKPLRGLPRRAKPSPAPVLADLSSSAAPDASIPRSIATLDPPPPRSSTSRGRPKFRVGDDDSSESNSGSPSTENGSSSGADGTTSQPA